MYTTTFYSFKGGVGRTMALVNIAVELANRGRRVLVMDFDLEAPGLPTFKIFEGAARKPGIVDYVSTYLSSDEVPDVSDYIFECSGLSKGALFLLPAGKQDQRYSSKLASINWARLYAEREGYLLFEDLKEQLRAKYKPDYLLIDSRTGHTDIGGICTRQLPDAVVIMFFPNEQNLWGLAKVADDIRNESNDRKARKRDQIKLHFVPSNVPDLDDEDRILEERIARFRSTLGYDAPTATIHHYSNLILLNQCIFTKDRPASRLTREYLQLASEIVKNNLEDRDAALDTLKDIQSSLGQTDRAPDISLEDIEAKLQAISNAHPTDGEILYRKAVVRGHMGDKADARTLFSAAINAHYDVPPVYMSRALCLWQLGEQAEAISDIKSVLQRKDTKERDLIFAARWLADLDPKSLPLVARAPGFSELKLASRIQVVRALEVADETREIVERMLRSIVLDASGDKESRTNAEHRLILCLIGLQHYDEAIGLLRRASNDPSKSADITDRFNYAIADWGLRGNPNTELFQRTLELYKDVSRRPNANFLQCIALALALTGDFENAREKLVASRTLLDANPQRSFSCWSYLESSPDAFRKDLAEIELLLRGRDLQPVFMRARPAPMLPLETVGATLH